MKIIATILVSVLGLSSFCQAQNDADTLRAKDNRLIPLPTVSINFGITNLLSDVALSSTGPSAFTQFGYQLTISQRVTKFLNVSLDIFAGSVYGEEQRNNTNLNFRTSLFSQHLNVEYNFYPLLKPDARGRQLIRPYFGFGVGVISFRSKGDLKDKSGTAYQYWTDGNIYAEVEGTVDATEATLLERDFIYETELRDENLDGLRKYPQTAFSLPINAGVRFQISKNIGVNAAFTYALNFSDMLDNVSTEGIGDRQGNAGNDNRFFGSIGLSIFLGTTRPAAMPQPFSNELADAEKATSEEKKTEEVEAKTSESSLDTANTTQRSENASAAQIDEQTATNNLNKLADVSSLLTSEADKISEMQQQAEVAHSSFQTQTKALKKELEDATALSKEKKPEVAELINKMKTDSEQFSAAESAYAQQTKTLKKETVLSSDIITKRENISSNIAKANKEFREAQKALTKELKKAKTKTDALVVLGNIEKQNENKHLALTSIAKQQQQLAHTEKVVLLEKRIELIGQLHAEDRISNNDSSSISTEEYKKAIGKEISALAKHPAATSEQIETLAAKFQSAVLQHSEPEEEQEVVGTPEQKNTAGIEADASTDSEVTEKTLPTNEVSTKDETASSFSKGTIENTSAKETGSFHWADIDHSGSITPDEVLRIIDLLFEGDSPHTVEDIQALIDYFFDQE